MKLNRSKLRRLIMEEITTFTSNVAYSDPKITNDINVLDDLYHKWDSGQMNIQSEFGNDFFMLLRGLLSLLKEGVADDIFGREKTPNTGPVKKDFEKLLNAAIEAREGVTQTVDGIEAQLQNTRDVDGLRSSQRSAVKSNTK